MICIPNHALHGDGIVGTRHFHHLVDTVLFGDPMLWLMFAVRTTDSLNGFMDRLYR